MLLWKRDNGAEKQSISICKAKAYVGDKKQGIVTAALIWNGEDNYNKGEKKIY
jgi:hypothetical protein